MHDIRNAATTGDPAGILSPPDIMCMDKTDVMLARNPHEPAGIVHALHDPPWRPPCRHTRNVTGNIRPLQGRQQGTAFAQNNDGTRSVFCHPVREIKQLTLLAINCSAAPQKQHSSA
jgi:hypothetical protein